MGKDLHVTVASSGLGLGHVSEAVLDATGPQDDPPLRLVGLALSTKPFDHLFANEQRGRGEGALAPAKACRLQTSHWARAVWSWVTKSRDY